MGGRFKSRGCVMMAMTDPPKRCVLEKGHGGRCEFDPTMRPLCQSHSLEYVDEAIKRLPLGTTDEILGLVMEMSRGAVNPTFVKAELARRGRTDA